VRRRVSLLVVAVVVVAACAGPSEQRVVIAAGTTLVDSGFIQAVIDVYVEDHPEVTMSVVPVGSAEAIAYARAGSADLIITHEPHTLATYLAETPDAVASSPFASSFVVVAPPESIVDGRDVVAAFRSIAASGLTFVSRDDGSGTNVREREIWEAAGIDPDGEDWYLRTGSGMGSSLLVTDQRSAVTLSELGAFLSATPALDLTIVPLADTTGLDNPYSVTVPSPADSAAALDFQSWLSSKEGRSAIVDANERLFGTVVYRVP
jgi:tungstate transport system substrate-binding protein